MACKVPAMRSRSMHEIRIEQTSLCDGTDCMDYASSFLKFYAENGAEGSAL